MDVACSIAQNLGLTLKLGLNHKPWLEANILPKISPHDATEGVVWRWEGRESREGVLKQFSDQLIGFGYSHSTVHSASLAYLQWQGWGGVGVALLAPPAEISDFQTSPSSLMSRIGILKTPPLKIGQNLGYFKHLGEILTKIFHFSTKFGQNR